MHAATHHFFEGNMQIDIYQSVAQPKKHLSVAANTDIKLLNLEDLIMPMSG
jgi:hypothetical protein